MNALDFLFERDGKYGFDNLGRWNATDTKLRDSFAKDHKLKSDEYIDTRTGLITCTRCHKPRQHFIDRFFGWMYLNCQCQDEADEISRRKEKLRDKAASIREIAFEDYPIGLRYTFGNLKSGFSPNAENFAHKYVADFDIYKSDGMGITFWSDVGRGKTYIATAIMHEIIDTYGKLVRFVRAADLVKASKFEDKMFERYKNCSLIVLDDVGAEDDKGIDVLKRFLDYAEAYVIPLIVTSNLNFGDTARIESTEYRRIADRIAAHTIMMNVRGDNFRKEKNNV